MLFHFQKYHLQSRNQLKQVLFSLQQICHFINVNGMFFGLFLVFKNVFFQENIGNCCLPCQVEEKVSMPLAFQLLHKKNFHRESKIFLKGISYTEHLIYFCFHNLSRIQESKFLLKFQRKWQMKYKN